MGAVNYIVFAYVCPACGVRSVIHAQTHFASNIGYCGETYNLGDPMEWYSRSEPEYDSWSEDKDFRYHTRKISEACYATCRTCDAKLCAVLEFEEIHASRCLWLSREADWHEDYPR